MPLKGVHDSLDEIPEEFQSLYTEKNGKFELTGIQGIKTQADIDRLQVALSKERDGKKTLKEKYSVWNDFNYDEVVAKLDKFPELEAAASGKLDEAAIEEIVQKRVQGTIASQMSPLQRDLKKAITERDEYKTHYEDLKTEREKNLIEKQVGAALQKAGVQQSAFRDAFLLAREHFALSEDSKVLTKDGIDPSSWVLDRQEDSPHWWPPSQGGGATPPNGRGGGKYPDNPWSHDTWNMTQQGHVLRTLGREKADQMAKAAGTTIGGPKPKSKENNK